MKTVIFDFDGTLTKEDQNIWKMIWQRLGYQIDRNSVYSKLYVDCVINKTISRQKWFDETCLYYKAKNMNRSIYNTINHKIRLISGFKETIKRLKEQGYKLVILSGCIVDTIKSVLGDNCKYFDIIESNKILFNENGSLEKLIPTKYDDEGKMEFVKEYIQKTNSDPKDIVFVGNSNNDEFVYQSGVKTICINPTSHVDMGDSKKWNKIISEVYDLRQILPEFNCEEIQSYEK